MHHSLAKHQGVAHAAAMVALSVMVAHGADTPLSRQHADAFQQKIVTIATAGTRTAARSTAGGGVRTPVTETELNSWFAFNGQPLLPSGVAEPKISMVGQGRVSGGAIVDLDAVAKRKASGGMLDPWSYVGGRVPVMVTGILHTKDGVGRFQLESAEVSGVPVPKTLLQELVAYYSRTENHPNGVNLDDPFELPANINRIEVGQGTAVVVQ